MWEEIVGGIVALILGGLLGNVPLRRRYAVRRALRSTPGATPALRAAVSAVRSDLRPSFSDGRLLRDRLLEAMGPEKNEQVVVAFLRQLEKRLSDRGMHVSWDLPPAIAPPVTRPRPAEPSMQGRAAELEQVRGLIEGGSNVVIRGGPGIGKTTLLEALRARLPAAAWARLEQGGGAVRDLLLSLSLFSGVEFPPDDYQSIVALQRALPEETVLLVDNADEPESAEALLRLIGHLPQLRVAVTSRGQSFPGFRAVELAPLRDEDAAALLADTDLSPEKRDAVLEAAGGIPLLLRQDAWAAEAGVYIGADDRLPRMLQRLDPEERRGLWLIGELPSATVPVELLVDVGHVSDQGLALLRRNAVLKPVTGGYEVHQTLRLECRQLLTVVPRDGLRELRADAGAHYVDWLRASPDLEAVDAALPNLMHLVTRLEEPAQRADLALALIGDHRDDPRGYLPARGLSSLFVEQRPLLEQTAAEIGGLRAAQIEKNLGLFCYWSNDPAAEALLRSARARYREIGDDEGRAAATWILGYLADDRCDYAQAEALYSAPLEWLGQSPARAVSHHLVGCSLYHQGRYDAARKAFDEARRETDSRSLRARIERRLAYIELAAGDSERALEQLERTRAEANDLDRPRDVARIDRHLAQGHLRRGNLDEAERALTRAREAFERLGDERGLGATLGGLATTRRRQGRLDEARELAVRSRWIAEAREARSNDPAAPFFSPVGVANAEEELSLIAAEVGDEQAAVAHLRRACNVFEAIGHARAKVLAERLGDARDALVPAPRGIVFDLIGGLARADTFDASETAHRLAERFGAEPDQFEAAWARSRERAFTDANWTVAGRIRSVLRELHIAADADVVEDRAAQECARWTSCVELRPETLGVLQELENRDIKLALVTSGSAAMRPVAHQLGLSRFLALSLVSCEAGALVSNPDIYEQALRALGLPAGDCLYVSDGRDRSLDGAKAAGLFAVRLLANGSSTVRISNSFDWDATVHTLSELVQRLGERDG